MPTIKKQSPTALNGVPSAPAGSILSMATDAASLQDSWVKLCLYGRNRTGKTTLACQFPKPLLLVSMEPSGSGGSKSIAGIAGVKVIRLSKTADVEGLAKELAASNPFKTVVLDGATSLQDIVLTEIMGMESAPEMLSYGIASMDQYRDRSQRTRELLRPFLNLPCHVVVVAQEKDHNPPKEIGKSKLTRGMQMESFFAADLGGATVKWLHDACDYIAQLYQDKETRVDRVVLGKGTPEEKVVESEVETGRIVRRLRTLYHPNFAAGFRSENPEAVPEWIQDASPKGMFDKMMKVIQGIKLTSGAKYPS